MSNKAYDTIKFISLIIAPVATFMAALTQIWGIPYGTEITATLAALDALLGAIVIILRNNYIKNQQKTEELPEEGSSGQEEG